MKSKVTHFICCFDMRKQTTKITIKKEVNITFLDLTNSKQKP